MNIMYNMNISVLKYWNISDMHICQYICKYYMDTFFSCWLPQRHADAQICPILANAILANRWILKLLHFLKKLMQLRQDAKLCFEVISLPVKSYFNIGFPERSELRWKGAPEAFVILGKDVKVWNLIAKHFEALFNFSFSMDLGAESS